MLNTGIDRASMEIVLFKVCVVGAILIAALPDAALAQQLTDSVKAVNTGIKDLPPLISGLIYITGGLFILSGSVMLKKYGESPNSVPMMAGVGRLGVGSFLVAVQPAVGWLQTTLATTGATPQGVGKVLPGLGT